MSWRFVLACEFAVGEPLSGNLAHGKLEALAIVHVLAVVVPESLLIKVTVKMKRFHTHVGSRNAALEKRPEILKPVRVHAAIGQPEKRNGYPCE